jgi:hypothetical protein
MFSQSFETSLAYFTPNPSLTGLKTNVLKAFDDGTIKAMAFPKGITANHKIPNAFPFILVPQGSDIGAVAIVDNYVSVDKTLDKVNIDTQKFYTLIETAYVARAIQKNPNVVRNANMYTNGAAIWAHMFTRLLNKKLALNVDKKAFDNLQSHLYDVDKLKDEENKIENLQFEYTYDILSSQK